MILLANGDYLKLFRRKRLLSSALFSPYATRFINNAKKLHQLKIPTVNPVKLYYLPHIERTAVHYKPLTGSTLRDISKNSTELRPLFEHFGKFLAELHQKGVYFRSIHMGNVVLQSPEVFGLIDVADLKLFRKPLSEQHRQRNMKHLLRPKADRPVLDQNLQFLTEAYEKKRLALKIK